MTRRRAGAPEGDDSNRQVQARVRVRHGRDRAPDRRRTAMTDGPHHSIGEVLSLLKEEHEDLTISKIASWRARADRADGPVGLPQSYDTDIDRPLDPFPSGTTSCPQGDQRLRHGGLRLAGIGGARCPSCCRNPRRSRAGDGGSLDRPRTANRSEAAVERTAGRFAGRRRGRRRDGSVSLTAGDSPSERQPRVRR